MSKIEIRFSRPILYRLLDAMADDEERYIVADFDEYIGLDADWWQAVGEWRNAPAEVGEVGEPGEVMCAGPRGPSINEAGSAPIPAELLAGMVTRDEYDVALKVIDELKEHRHNGNDIIINAAL